MATNKEQFEFVKLVSLWLPRVVYYCEQNNTFATFGDAYRDPRCPYGSERSKHHERLAIDINLIKNRKLIRDSQGHSELGEEWKRISSNCTWGGRWGDFNHYSFKE